MTGPQRFQALQTAERAFSHHNKDRHTREVEAGAVHALTLKLGYVLMSRQQPQHQPQHQHPQQASEAEIQCICRCFQHVLNGCSTHHKLQTWQEMGPSELVPLLLQVLSTMGQAHGTITTSGIETAREVCSVLRVFGKLPVAVPALIRFPGLIPLCLSIMVSSFERFQQQHQHQHQQHQQGGGPPMQDVSGYSGIERDDDDSLLLLLCEFLGIFKDWAFQGGRGDKEVMYNTQGIVDVLLNIQQRTDRARIKEYVTAIWWNLARSHEVAAQMLQSPDFLTACQQELARTMTTTTTATTTTTTAAEATTDQSFTKTKRNTISTLGNLASLSSSQLVLERDDALWELLRSIALTEPDADCRRRAVRMIRCLSSAPVFATRPGLFPCLIAAAKDTDRDVRRQALETLRNNNNHLPIDQEQDVPTLISLVGESSDYETVAAVCRVLAATNKPFPLDPTTGVAFFRKLRGSSLPQPPDQERAVLDCVRLALQHPENATTIRALSPSCEASNKAMLDLLASLTTQQAAVMDLILELANEHNRKTMAENEALLSTIISFAQMTTDTNVKTRAKALLATLVNEL